MEELFPVYRGNDPYFFVCYAHDDRDIVYPEMFWLHEHGVKLWYDEGIAPGEEWSEELGHAIDNAAALLFFVTPNAVASIHCRNEVHFAQNHGTPILALHIVQTALPVGLDLALGASQAIHAHQLKQINYRQRLLQGALTLAGRAATAGGSQTQPSSTTVDPREPPRKRWRVRLTLSALLAAACALVYLMWDGTDESPVYRTNIPRVAVLPFENRGSDPQYQYFSDGLSEDVATALSRSTVLTIIPPNVTATYAKADTAIAQDLGARYIVRGSVRRGVSDLRVSAQLLDPANGEQLWAQTYDRNLDASDLFDIQAEISARIAATLANATGVVVSLGLQNLRRRPTDSFAAYDCVLKGHAYVAIHTDQTHREARDCLERAVEIDAAYADAWAHLAYLYQEEYHHNRNVEPHSLERALRAAQRAVELDQANSMGLFALAMTRLSRGELDIGLSQMDRALASNPTDTMILSGAAVYYVYVGKVEKGLALAARARELHQTPPPFIHQALAAAHYLRGEYEQTLRELGNWTTVKSTDSEIFRAASLGMLGRERQAQQVLNDLLAADEVFARDPEGELRRLFLASETMNAVMLGLSRAGLRVPAQGQ